MFWDRKSPSQHLRARAGRSAKTWEKINNYGIRHKHELYVLGSKKRTRRTERAGKNTISGPQNIGKQWNP